MPKIYTGLDIGTSSVKIVQLKREAGDVELVSQGIEEIPRGKEGVERRILVAQAINKIVSEKKIKLQKTISSISGRSVVIRNLQLPAVPEEELGDSVRYEAEQYMPFPAQEAVLDFLVLDRVTDRGSEKLEVAVVGVQKGVLEEHISLTKEVGCKLEAIGVVPFALRNALLGEEKGVIALVDIGGGISNISIFKNRVLRFVRDIFIGGDNLTQALSDSLQIDFKKAEEQKKQYGIIFAEGETEVPEALRVSQVLRPELDQLLIEVRRSFDYYLAQSREARIDKVILSGGTARLKKIDEFFTESLGIETEISHPLKEASEFGPLLAVATGLALSGYEERKINLLPRKLRPRELRLDLLFKNKLLVAGAALGILLLLSFSTLSLRMGNYTRKINRVRKQIAGHEAALVQAGKIRRQEKILRDKNTLLVQLIAGRFLWSEVLREMGGVIPEGLWLKELVLGKAEEGIPEEVVVKGAAFSNQLIAQYMIALENLPYFENVDLIFTNKGESAIDFEIKGNLQQQKLPPSE